MKKYIILAIIALVIIVTAIVAIISNNQKEEPLVSSLATTKVKVNEVTRSVFYAPQYVAIANGYFKENGIEIDLTTGQGADQVMTAVLSGQSDIGFARTRSSDLCI